MTVDTTALRKIAARARLDVDKARDVLEEFRDLRDAAEALGDSDLGDSVESLLAGVEALEEAAALGLFVDVDTALLLRSALEDFQNIETDLATAILEAFDEVEQALDEIEEHRESPREYDADTKAQAREECQERLVDLADALDAAAPGGSSP